jgi:outer membrane lipoprotein-sorting protein
LALFSVLLLLVPSSLPGADPNAVLDAWLAAQANFTHWSADFIQTRSLKALRQPLTSPGRVWFAKPNHFRWELGRPAQTVAVRDAGQLQVIYPKLKRVERYPLVQGKSGPLGEALGLLDAGFPRSRADFDARFRVASLHATNAAWSVELQPVSPSARRLMPSIRLWLATNDFTLLANELTFLDGSRMRNDFSNAQRDAPFPPDTFRPVLAPDYKIVQPATQ